MNLRPLMFLPPVAIGIGLFIWMTSPDTAPQGDAPAETALPVRVQTVAASSLTPTITGYGRVVAEESWSAISQVNGRADMVLAKLEAGNVIGKGTEIVRIDPRDYQIALASATAARDSAQASLDELQAKEANTRATIALENRIEQVLQADMERHETLFDRGSVSQKLVDDALRALLVQQKLVLDFENALRLIPAQRNALMATLATRNADIEEAERALANTSLLTPITGRVVDKQVANGQYVRIGDTLATLETTSASEVVAQFQTRVLGNLFLTLRAANPAAMAARPDVTEISDVLRGLSLTASAHMVVGEATYIWPADLVRFEGSADAITGTVGLVVRIEDPFGLVGPRAGPPLSNGTFVEVHLAGPFPVSAIRIPRSVMRVAEDGSRFVYTMDAQNRLTRSPVETGPVHGNLISITNGLPPGTVLVLSDPQPAIIGALLDPIFE